MSGVAAVHGTAASHARWSAATPDTGTASTAAPMSSVTHQTAAATGTRPAVRSEMTRTVAEADSDSDSGTSVP